MYLIKEVKSGGYPKPIESLDAWFPKGKYAQREVLIGYDPDDNPKIQEAIANTDSYPDWDCLIDDYMSEFSCKCTSPGTPDVLWTRDGDPGWPGDPPEFDLPDPDDYKWELLNAFAEQLLEENGLDKNLMFSLKLSSNDRKALLEAAEEDYSEKVGSWPDYDDLIEKYVPDDYYDEPDEPEYNPY